MLYNLKQLQKEGKIKFVNAGVLIKDRSGKTNVTETADVDARQGAIFGALVGGVIGLLGGPIGVVAGAAAGAATGGLAARSIDMGIPKQMIDDLRQGLRPGTSAIIALVEPEWLDQLTAAVEGTECRIAQCPFHSQYELLKQQIEAQMAKASQTPLDQERRGGLGA